MKTLVLIDEDPAFTSRVADHFRNIRVVSRQDAKNSSRSAFDLVKENPRAQVWIDVATRHPLTADVLLDGVGLTACLIRYAGIAPLLIRLTGDQPEGQLPESTRREMRSLGVAYVEKAQAIEIIEKQFGKPGERVHSKASDLRWAFRVLGTKVKYKEYVGKVVAVYRRQVWGSGPDLVAAREEALAKEGCPAVRELTFARVYDRTPKIVPPMFGIDRVGPVTSAKGSSVDG
jgi:hypothetical protein